MNWLSSSIYSGKPFSLACKGPSSLVRNYPLPSKGGTTKHPHSTETGESPNDFWAKERTLNRKRKLWRRHSCFWDMNKTPMLWTSTDLQPRKEPNSWRRESVSNVGNQGIWVGTAHHKALKCQSHKVAKQQQHISDQLFLEWHKKRRTIWRKRQRLKDWVFKEESYLDLNVSFLRYLFN